MLKHFSIPLSIQSLQRQTLEDLKLVGTRFPRGFLKILACHPYCVKAVVPFLSSCACSDASQLKFQCKFSKE